MGLALRLTGWCQNKWTSSTGNLPSKRRDITEQLLKAALNTNQPESSEGRAYANNEGTLSKMV